MKGKSIKHQLRNSLLGKMRLYHFLRFQLKKKNIPVVMKTFLGNDVSDERKKQLTRMMKEAMVRYRWDFDEFFLFDYEHSDEERRHQLVPEYEKNIVCDQLNDFAKADAFYDKWLTYVNFKDFFKRDAVSVKSLSDLDSMDFATFVEKHPEFILKPSVENCGTGVRIIQSNGLDDAKVKLSTLIQQKAGDFVLEELIVQDERMAILHPGSINTLRLPTIRLDDRVEILPSYIRCGVGKMRVDNVASGGLIGMVDLETGKVFSAFDGMLHPIEVHPDTHVPLVGFEVPQIKEALALVKQLALVIPEVRYVGWDLALTPDGWVLVEGNDKGQFWFQYTLQKGFRDALNSFKKELGLLK